MAMAVGSLLVEREVNTRCSKLSDHI